MLFLSCVKFFWAQSSIWNSRAAVPSTLQKLQQKLEKGDWGKYEIEIDRSGALC